jgi:predicted NBD/HSP70 family sugar kinase
MNESIDPAPAHIMRTLFDGAATSRAQLARVTGYARSTVGGYIETLLEREILLEAPSPSVAPGRPALRLLPGRRAPRIGIVDLGESRSRVIYTDLVGHRLWSEETSLSMSTHSPTALLPAIRTMLSRGEIDTADLGGAVGRIIVGVPHPVAHRTGELARTARLPDWAGVALSEALATPYGPAVAVENDADLLALGTARRLGSAALPLIYIHLGTGVGIGMVDDRGAVHRGAQGAAGSVGHIPVPSGSRFRCECGRSGCVVAVAGATALLHRIDRSGATTLRDVARSALSGERQAISEISTSAVAVGELASIVSDIYNPCTVVLGGDLTLFRDWLLPTVRSTVYGMGLPLATENLQILATPQDFDGLAAGASVIARDEILRSGLV